MIRTISPTLSFGSARLDNFPYRASDTRISFWALTDEECVLYYDNMRGCNRVPTFATHRSTLRCDDAWNISTSDFLTSFETFPRCWVSFADIPWSRNGFEILGTYQSLYFWIRFLCPSVGSSYLVSNERQAFFTSGDPKPYKFWSCQNVCEALIYLLDNIFIWFGPKLYRQIVVIPMGTNCAPLVADLFYSAIKTI